MFRFEQARQVTMMQNRLATLVCTDDGHLCSTIVQSCAPVVANKTVESRGNPVTWPLYYWTLARRDKSSELSAHIFRTTTEHAVTTADAHARTLVRLVMVAG